MLYFSFISRYKCICPATWPTYSGSSVNGVREIVSQQKVEKDVEYGKTKIFVRSPQTLFNLEAERERALPPLVVLLQKVRDSKMLRFLLIFLELSAAFLLHFGAIIYRIC